MRPLQITHTNTLVQLHHHKHTTKGHAKGYDSSCTTWRDVNRTGYTCSDEQQKRHMDSTLSTHQNGNNSIFIDLKMKARVVYIVMYIECIMHNGGADLAATARIRNGWMKF